ncbi:NUDIX domain-containing protein [Patescibacteria group bacterium]|nr:NUDIX domain-containing protein [Patescibacteria group bacterium]MBU1890097.1 NUDIX domain-containing protein [Patescibacteria group bacterium]
MLEISKSLIIKDGKYLILKRAPTSKTFPGVWDFPGGKNNINEPPEGAVIRETLEETSLTVVPDKIVMQRSYKKGELDLHINYFTILSYSGELKLSPEHTDYKWVRKEELKEYDVSPVIKLFLM